MIKFFRKIRQKLIEQSKVRSYFIYAIGEIVLVVIGILIALQINNWNEHKKTNAEVKKLIQALRNDLVQDTMLIAERYPEVMHQYQLNETFRHRIAKPDATLDTLIKITRHEFNPNWHNPIIYNSNAYNSLNETGLIEELNDSLKLNIKNFYNGKSYHNRNVERMINDYRDKLSIYLNTYIFGSTALHDHGKLIDSLIWDHIDPAHLAASFNGISNFKRLLFRDSKNEMEYSMDNSRKLIQHIDQYLK